MPNDVSTSIFLSTSIFYSICGLNITHTHTEPKKRIIGGPIDPSFLYLHLPLFIHCNFTFDLRIDSTRQSFFECLFLNLFHSIRVFFCTIQASITCATVASHCICIDGQSKCSASVATAHASFSTN